MINGNRLTIWIMSAMFTILLLVIGWDRLSTTARIERLERANEEAQATRVLGFSRLAQVETQVQIVNTEVFRRLAIIEAKIDRLLSSNGVD